MASAPAALHYAHRNRWPSEIDVSGCSACRVLSQGSRTSQAGVDGERHCAAHSDESDAATLLWPGSQRPPWGEEIGSALV